jgi:tartrate-resistant acid phosphatase type 5
MPARNGLAKHFPSTMLLPACSFQPIRQLTHGLIMCAAVLLSSCSVIDDFLNIKPGDTKTDGSETGVIKFVAMGDTGHGNDGQYQVAQAVKNKCAQDGCDFILLLGDNIYNSGVDSVDDFQFDTKFELPYQDIDLPFYLVLGNHDYGGANSGLGYEFQKSVYQIMYTEKSEKWNMPQHYYQFIKGNATFFALDTNAQLYGLDNEQRQDVAQWLANTQTTWKIAYGHHPYKSNGPHGNAGQYDVFAGIPIANGEKVKTFAEDIWCGKVDLYISGHDHSRQWLDTDCAGTRLIVSGAGSTTTELRGNNPALFQKATLGFLYIRIEGNKLTGQFIDAHGNVEFTHGIEKSQN